MPKIIPFKIIQLDAKSFHPILTGRLGDDDINLILDTGASRTVLGKHITKEFPTIECEAEEAFAAGINAQTMEVEQLEIPEITIGESTFENLLVFSTNLDGISEIYQKMAGLKIDGLIGCDFLVKYKATINFKMRKIVLYP
ncbi:MAG TPA: hypothetical protein DG754_12990 [Bacteroidales bacterium]|jgi:hypothetical protein|nr:hypothetical protein [Bacteroidales bacterium]